MRKVAVSAECDVVSDIDVLAGNDVFTAGTHRCHRQRGNHVLEQLYHFERQIFIQSSNPAEARAIFVPVNVALAR
jgi:hypothetical protein